MKPALRLSAILALCATPVHATILLNDTFSDGDRTNANLPGSAAWFLAGSGAAPSSNPPSITSTVTSGTLVNTTNSNGATFALAASFASSGYTLAAGETLRLTFDVTLSYNGNSSADAFRFGFFDSKGSPITADANGSNGGSAQFNEWRGYSFWNPYGTTTGLNASIRKRVANDQVLYLGSVNSSRDTTPYTSGDLVNGITYQGLFTITNNGDDFEIHASLGNTSLSWTDDTSSPVTTFDSIAFFAGGTPMGAGGSFTLDNVMVDVVPEPSSIFLAGLASLTFLRRRR